MEANVYVILQRDDLTFFNMELSLASTLDDSRLIILKGLQLEYYSKIGDSETLETSLSHFLQVTMNHSFQFFWHLNF